MLDRHPDRLLAHLGYGAAPPAFDQADRGGALLLAGFFTFQFDRILGHWLMG